VTIAPPIRDALVPLLEALSLKTDGILLLDAAATPIFMNDAAAAILRRGDGLCERDGLLCSVRLPETRRLHRMIAGSGADGRLLISRRGGERPYLLHYLPVPSGDVLLAAHKIAGVLHIYDLGVTQGASPAALTAIFGLTDREAELASALSRRGQLGQAAAEARMAYNTARNHLQSIFRKTGTTNQVEVAQLLARLP
jgi:DNA-binding CsgD family transcriptional regulator